jgi:hypothetical protein
VILAALTVALALQSVEPLRMTIDAGRPLHKVSRSLYGIFFEEINQAGDGGIYAELLRNRGMEEASADKLPPGWKVLNEGGAGKVTTDSNQPLNAARPMSLLITRDSAQGRFGVTNEGFWGIPLHKGASYDLILWAKGDVPLQVELDQRTTLPAPGTQWKRLQYRFRASGDNPKALLNILPLNPGTVSIAFASLKPVDTWKSSRLRKDLAQKVANMKPAFVRFPGGCFVEGNDLAQAFDWKKSLGPEHERPGSAKRIWGYPSTDGLGFHEYLQWCEDLGAEALYVANCGISHTQIQPMSAMGRYVQDALDAIEYANGPATSKWGAMRAKNGHPKPFKLKYVEIGNENGGGFFGGNTAIQPTSLATG